MDAVRARTRGLSRGFAIAIVVVVAYVAATAALVTVGSGVRLPDDEAGMSPQGGGIGAFTHQLLGQADPTDMLLDYASAWALLHDRDAYSLLSELTEAVGYPWPVFTANPHPPTLLTFMLPYAAFPYRPAETAWALAMVGALVATIRLVGLRWLYAIPLGTVLAMTFPGAYAISNPVPLSGLGVAVAYRYRDRPWIAGAGLTLAAAPKVSGILLIAPFVVSRRWRHLAPVAVMLGATAAVPLLWQPDVWSRYLDAGVRAINAGVQRGDNASAVELLKRVGLPSSGALLALGLLALAAAWWSRDTWWPTVWLTVAALPIAWMYSLVPLLPLVVIAARRHPAGRALALLMAGVVLSSPPLGQWPRVASPVALAICYALLYLPLARHEPQFGPSLRFGSAIIWPRRLADVQTAASGGT